MPQDVYPAAGREQEEKEGGKGKEEEEKQSQGLGEGECCRDRRTHVSNQGPQ